MDDIDRAQEREQQLRDDALAAQARRAARSTGFAAGIRPAESLEICAECGCRIPDERRSAVPGVALCVDCQEWTEQQQRRKAA